MTSRSFLRTPSEAAGPGDEQVIEDLVDTLEAVHGAWAWPPT